MSGEPVAVGHARITRAASRRLMGDRGATYVLCGADCTDRDLPIRDARAHVRSGNALVYPGCVLCADCAAKIMLEARR